MALQMILRQACLAIGCVAVGLLAGLPATAQNAAPPRTTQTAPPPPGSAPVAPAIHRQPRAADVTTSAQDESPNSPFRESAEDAAMNRMIRSICRGC